MLEKTLNRLEARGGTLRQGEESAQDKANEGSTMMATSKANRENFQRWLTAPQSPTKQTLETIYRCFQENLSSTLTVTHPNSKIQQQARSHLQPRWSIFSSTGARYLKEFMRQYSPPYKLTPNDWRTFL